MSDYYHQFLTSMSSAGASSIVNTQQQYYQQQYLQQQQQQQLQQQQQQQLMQQQHDSVPLSLPPHMHPQPAMAGTMVVAPNQYQSLGFYTGFPEPVFNAQKSQRHRRKSAQGLEHVKHRRTRSGCYTCRSRRIKCDEARPVCERCKKGKRDCAYPESSSGTKQAGSGQVPRDASTPSQPASPASSNDDDNDDEVEQDSKLATIPDDDEEPTRTSVTAPGGEEAWGQGTSELAPTTATTLKTEGRQPLQLTVSMSSRPAAAGLRRSSATSSSNLKRLAATGANAGSGTGNGGSASGTRQSSETPSLDGRSPSSTSTSTTYSQAGPAYAFASPEPFPSATSASTTGAGAPFADWGPLSQDLQFFLGYFREHITHYHYCIPLDSEHFFSEIMPSVALQDEALLYAMVGFSAYHHMLSDPMAKMQQFLFYYDRSVKLLLRFLKSKEKHTVGTLLTILQLAAMEEYLGDWVNLMGHQKAALEVLMELYTPETVMQTPTGRMILRWYSRFDNFVGLMGGFRTALSRNWFTTPIEYYQTLLEQEPNSLDYKFHELLAQRQLISLDMSVLFGHIPGGLSGMNSSSSGGGGAGHHGSSQSPPMAGLPNEAFIQEHTRIANELYRWKDNLDAIVRFAEVMEGGRGGDLFTAATEKSEGGPKSQMPQHPLLVTEFPHAQPLGPDDIVNPYQPGLLYHEPLFVATVISCEWESIVLMHEFQAAQLAMLAAAALNSAGTGNNTALAGAGTGAGARPRLASTSDDSPGSQTSSSGPADELPPGFARLAERAFTICRAFETIERWPEAPPGVLFTIQAAVTIAALFLPRDQRHRMWVRRKFAMIESIGHIFPLTMRTRMAEVFGDPSCARWWLPNDVGFSPILQSVRAFADERNVTAVSAQLENLREIRHIFVSLTLNSGGGSGGSGGGDGSGSVSVTSTSTPDTGP